MSTVLVVDDVAAMREQYAYDLRRLGGHEVLTAGGGAEALRLLAEQPVDCVILDLEMPGTDGFAVLEELRRRGDRVPVLVYTGTGDYERCVRAVKLGAWNFIDKSEPLERVAREVENALAFGRLRREVRELRRRAEQDAPLVGRSRAMEALRETIVRLAPIPSAVLVQGESGSGKELVARELHARGRRPDGPFVAVNCAALPEPLAESELFGHERGAFTGADRPRKGAFESASGGTLFLDEVGELPAAAQAKLLRVLEEGKVVRLGASAEITVDARVVAATNRDLEREVAAGRFRQDLLFRLAVHVLRVPPLRERLSDLPLLTAHLLERTCRRFGTAARAAAPETVALLQRYDWSRNNVRELRNVLERMVIACAEPLIGPDCVPAEIRAAAGEGPAGSAPAAGAEAPGEPPRGEPTPSEPATAGPAAGAVQPAGRGRAAPPPPASPLARPGTLKELRAEAERQIVLAALERHDWRIGRAAAELGLADHSSLLKIMRRHGLKRR